MTAARGFPAFPPRPGRRGRSWWAREFVAAMEDAALDQVVLRRGRRFAGSGRVGPITVSPGRIAAVVDDPDGAFDVVVRFDVLDAGGWDRFVGQVTAEAGHLAALLDGEVPRALVRSAAVADVALLPTSGDLESDCGCPDVGDPCLHAAALCHQVAWLLDDDPFVLLLLRGRDRDTLLVDLGARSTAPPADGTDAPIDAAAAYAAGPAGLPAPPQGPGPGGEPVRPDRPAFPPAPGEPDGVLTSLVATAARRARALLG